MDWTAIAVVSGLVVNAVVVAFGYGVLTQKVNNFSVQSTKMEKTVNDNRRDIEHNLETKAHLVLPECQSTFLQLASGISELKGKIDTLILIEKSR